LRPRQGYAKSKAMPTERPPDPAGKAEPGQPPEKRPLTPAAERALAEAATRRAERDSRPDGGPKEASGRSGLDPTRYGDWEKNGLASDF
jgi:hypothetical protein